MSYVAQTLSHGETVIGKAGYHWLFYALASWPFAIALLLAIPLGIAGAVNFLVLLIILVIGIALTAFSWVPLLFTEIAVTNQRLILKRGWLKWKVQELGLRAIEEIKLSQSILGRALNYGQLIARGTGEGNIGFPPIAKPIDFRRRIEEARRIAIYEDYD